jgi:hypothetical protein
MAFSVLSQIRQALRNLNPAEVKDLAERPVRIGLVAPTAQDLGLMESFFAPGSLSGPRRAEAVRMLIRGGAAPSEIHVYHHSVLRPANAFSFNPENPEECVRRIVRAHPEYRLALARRLPPFRKEVAQTVIRAVSKENAVFSLATAIPDVVPILSLPWAVGEFGSDAAFLTMNQIRMAFLLAAASDRTIGYREQKSEIATIIAGAFGWRALARELVGKVPFGGGMAPKAAIAWAGTFAIGLSIERFYRLGYGFSRDERRAVYEDAFDHGREIANMLLAGLRQRRAAS